jgi:SAM-dependent methyltransferase
MKHQYMRRPQSTMDGAASSSLTLLAMASLNERAFNRFYYGRKDFTDGTSEFHSMIAGQAATSGEILEIGCGPSNVTSDFLATLGNLTGLDVSEEVNQNRALSRALMFDGGRFPCEDHSFDLVVSNYVLEHVEFPETHFREVARVLRPGGAYVFRTPNLFHYVAAVSFLLPHRAHRVLANRLRRLPSAAHEPYPTFYRANTSRRLRSLLRCASLSTVEIRAIEKEPTYGRANIVLFIGMLAYERIVNRFNLLRFARSNYFGVGRRLL